MLIWLRTHKTYLTITTRANLKLVFWYDSAVKWINYLICSIMNCELGLCVCQRQRSVCSAWCLKRSPDMWWTTSPVWPGRIKWSSRASTPPPSMSSCPPLNTTETWVSRISYLCCSECFVFLIITQHCCMKWKYRWEHRLLFCCNVFDNERFCWTVSQVCCSRGVPYCCHQRRG